MKKCFTHFFSEKNVVPPIFDSPQMLPLNFPFFVFKIHVNFKNSELRHFWTDHSDFFLNFSAMSKIYESANNSF